MNVLRLFNKKISIRTYYYNFRWNVKKIQRFLNIIETCKEIEYWSQKVVLNSKVINNRNATKKSIILNVNISDISQIYLYDCTTNIFF